MGWQNSFNKSIFTTDSYKAAIGDTSSDSKQNGYAVIKISPTNIRTGSHDRDCSLVGIMQDPFSFGITAEWQPMGGMTGILPKTKLGDFVGNAYRALSDVGNLAGFGDMGSVYSSRLIYQKSGRLTLGAKLRVVDWEGSSEPIKAAILLSYLCLPDTTFGKSIQSEVLDLLNKLGKDVVKVVKKVESTFKDAAYNIPGASSFVGPLAESLVNGANEGVRMAEELAGDIGYMSHRLAPNATRNLEEIANSFINDISLLRSSPSPVNIEIGQYFKKNDMVITDVNFKFSKEMTSSGPLYIDIDLSLQSREILGDITDLGLNVVNNKSRVEFVANGQSTNNLNQ